mmetsp:Transcript_5816/g.12256  ORF Transcript_5816/g.12256 Transcript_5816/m.12256 type:complete len:204 (+) Transcript_5816:632-1243(+)
MGTANEIQIVLVKELCHDIFSKGEGDTSIVFTPSINFLVWIGPEQIAQQSSIRHIGGTDNALDLIQTGQFWTETSVHAKNLFVNDGGAGKAVEAIGESLPQLDSETSFALIVEAVDTIDGGALVVSTEDKEILGVLDFVSQQETNGFETLFSTVHVISQENVIGFRRKSSVFKQTKQIVVLSVDIPANLDGSFQLQQHGLSNQ